MKFHFWANHPFNAELGGRSGLFSSGFVEADEPPRGLFSLQITSCDRLFLEIYGRAGAGVEGWGEYNDT